MIVPDINLLLYATIDAFDEHVAARSWLEEAMNGKQSVGLATPVIFGYFRIATNRRIFDPPMPVDTAVSHVEQWLDRPHVHLLVPGPRHLEFSFDLLRRMGTAGGLTTDVQIAALAMEHDAEVHSNDTDFGRFRQIRWVNPLDEGT